VAGDRAQKLLDLDAEMKRLQDEIDAYQSETERLSSALWKLKGELATSEEASASIQRQANADTEKHQRDMQLDCCPFCKSKRKGWQSEIEREFIERAAAMRLTLNDHDQGRE
jgi:chromosome segregation ATPase